MSCLRPKQIRSKMGILETIPCGKCPVCCYNKMAGWTFRLIQEDKVSQSAHFITMTYDTDHLVSTPYGMPSLTKYDLQNFFKRLRKYHGGHSYYNKPIKYYAVGEYGTQTARPHYHIILYNADIELIQDAWSIDKKLIGDIYYGDVSHASIGYTLKYMNKTRYAGLRDNDDRHPEFTMQSNGLGLSYLSQNIRSYYHADMHNRRFLELPNGCKTPMPRYYYEKLFDGYQRDLLKMSGSLIRQDEFFKQFSQSYLQIEQGTMGTALFAQRVEAAYKRHNYQSNQLLKL